MTMTASNATMDAATQERIGEAIVVRHCTIRHMGTEHDAWPGQEIFLFNINPDNPDEYRCGDKTGKPIATIPKNAVLNKEYTWQTDLYYVRRVLSTTDLLMHAVNSGREWKVKAHNFPQIICKKEDLIRAVQEYAYIYLPPIDQFTICHSNADID